MSLRQEKKIFLIDLLCPKLDLLEQFGFGYSGWRFSNPHDLWMVPAEWRWLWMWPESLFYTHLKDFTVVMAQDTFPSHFLSCPLPLSEIACHEESNLTLMIHLGTTEGGCRALCHPSLGSLSTLFRLWHTGGREGKVLHLSSQTLKSSFFSRALPISSPWHLHKAGEPPQAHVVHRSWKQHPAATSALEILLFPKAVDGN